MLVKDIELFILSNDLPCDIDAPKGVFSTERFITNAFDKIVEADKETFGVLDRLCKKVDVVGVLYACYSEDLSTAVGAERARLPFLTHLCALYLYSASVWNDFKFINTALKILDHDSLLNDKDVVCLRDFSTRLAGDLCGGAQC